MRGKDEASIGCEVCDSFHVCARARVVVSTKQDNSLVCNLGQVARVGVWNGSQFACKYSTDT